MRFFTFCSFQEKKKQHHSSNTSKSGNKTSEDNDEQEEETAMDGSDVEKSPGDDVEVLEEAMNNLSLDENAVTGLNVEENSCENKNSVPSSCKDAMDTSGLANESRKDIKDIQEPRNTTTGEETDEPKDIQELQNMTTGEEKTDEPKDIQELQNMTTGEEKTDEPKDIQELQNMTTEENESPEDEKVVEMNSAETSEDFENKEEPKTNKDAGSAASDNVKLSKSPVEFPDSAESGMNTENMLPSGYSEDREQRDTGCEETDKEIQKEPRDATENDEEKSEEKEGENTRLCSDDSKDSENEVATTCHELNLGNVQNTHNVDSAKMQGNSGKDSDIDSANKSNPVIAPSDLVSCGNGSLNNLKHAFKNTPDVSQPISELNPIASNTLNQEVNDDVSSDSAVSSLNDLKHSGVKINNDNQVQKNAINSTNSSDEFSGLHPSNCAPKNKFNFPTNDVSSDAIASCRPLETSVKNVTENQAAGPSNEVEGSKSSVKDASKNKTPGPSNEVEGSESSVKDASKNKTPGPSNEVEPVFNGSISDPDPVSISDPSGESNTTTHVSNELERDPSLLQNPPNYDSKTATQPSEDDGCSNESRELQEGHSHSGPEDCLNGGAETEKLPHGASEILSGRHSLGDIGPFNPSTMSVENCLNKFCYPEKLDGNNKFKCQDCNKNTRPEEDDEETAGDKNVEENGKNDGRTSSEKSGWVN